MPEFNQNLWAPWRMEYIRSLQREVEDEGCFLCKYWAHPEQDAAHHVLWRSRSAFVVMNRFPYTNGHLLIAHASHKADLADLSDDELHEISRASRDAVEVLRRAGGAQGFNIGYNVGRCAGAGLPGHLHGHVVPRWEGDTNFMAVLGDARVLSDALDAAYADLIRAATAVGLRETIVK
jgi:ATP adenylyltransferase